MSRDREELRGYRPGEESLRWFVHMCLSGFVHGIERFDNEGDRSLFVALLVECVIASCLTSPAYVSLLFRAQRLSASPLYDRMFFRLYVAESLWDEQRARASPGSD